MCAAVSSGAQACHPQRPVTTATGRGEGAGGFSRRGNRPRSDEIRYLIGKLARGNYRGRISAE
jgi:hypothetical protein